MTRAEILARMQRESMRYPPKLRNMFSRYIEAINEREYHPARLCKLGASVLNRTFVKADEGCAETQATMQRDGIDAWTLSAAADLFAAAALQFEEAGKG